MMLFVFILSTMGAFSASTELSHPDSASNQEGDVAPQNNDVVPTFDADLIRTVDDFQSGVAEAAKHAAATAASALPGLVYSRVVIPNIAYTAASRASIAALPSFTPTVMANG